jgi:hypothetical protein
VQQQKAKIKEKEREKQKRDFASAFELLTEEGVEYVSKREREEGNETQTLQKIKSREPKKLSLSEKKEKFISHFFAAWHSQHFQLSRVKENF